VEGAVPVKYSGRPALTDGQQRQLHELELQTEQTTQDDRAFFARNPARRHRVRLAAEVELEALEVARGKPLMMPRGAAMFAVVRQLAEGLRIRTCTINAADAEVDLSEAEAAAVFAVVARSLSGG
jgi:hypothetical protein